MDRCLCVWVCMFVCCATPPTVLGQFRPDLLHGISMAPIFVYRGVLSLPVVLGRGGGERKFYVNVHRVPPLQVREGITSLHPLQDRIPVPTFSRAVRLFEFCSESYFELLV